MGYATLGPRSRRTSPSQFATLQRPRPSRSLSQSSAHSQPLPPQPPSAGCQAQCCQGARHLHGDECERHGLCRSASEDGHDLQPRRSSFHGPVRRESPHHYDAAALHPLARPVPAPSLSSPLAHPAHHQENGYGGAKHHQQDAQRHPGGAATNPSSRCPSRSASCSSHTNLSADPPSADDAQTPSSRGSPAHRDAHRDAHGASSAAEAREANGANVSRPRFPHDYVRQGSSKSKSSGRSGRDGGVGGGSERRQR